MASIEIDQDIYAYLLRRIEAFGETASDVLRRELGVPKMDANAASQAPEEHELSQLIGSPQFLRMWSVTDRYLAILAALYAKHQADFEAVLSIRGRQRVYFAKSREEVRNSGESTEPKQIPGSPFWAMTNASTPKKVGILHDVLTRLDVPDVASGAAIQALRA